MIMLSGTDIQLCTLAEGPFQWVSIFDDYVYYLQAALLAHVPGVVTKNLFLKVGTVTPDAH